ncbi:MAG: hypothetical protein JWM35_2540 [Verrucomicrobia bacterium]|nr:hypothetical protein [Verrucomicrobiota bacterium]
MHTLTPPLSSLYCEDMKTLSVTKARSNLTHWLKRAIAGEDLGILCGDKVIALRPVEIYPIDAEYVRKEYGMTEAQMNSFAKRMHAELMRDKKAGRTTRFKGDFDAAIRD